MHLYRFTDVKAKLLLSIGVLLCSSGLGPQTLQAASVPQRPALASVKPTVRSAAPIFFLTIPKNSQGLVAPKLLANVKSAQKAVAPSPRPETFLPVVDQEDIELKHRRIADEVLRLMPSECRGTLKNFYVRYDNPERRGLAGKNTLILSGNVNDAEFRALLIHELGHVFDLSENVNCLTGTADAGESEFRDGNDKVYLDDPSLQFYRISWANEKTQRRGAKPEDFVSGYASWDVFEDFSESMAYFVLHNEVFRERAKTNNALAAKYQWFQTYLFPNGIHVATTQHTWTGTVPWDSTKLPYVWAPAAALAQK